MVAKTVFKFSWVVGCLFDLGLSSLGCRPSAERVTDEQIGPRVAGEPGPVVARVGRWDLRLADVAPLAELALELRRQLDLPAPRVESLADQVDLAVELLALAAQTESAPATGAARIEERARRLLVRIFLDRTMAQMLARPITDEERRQVYQREKSKTLSTGESDLYRPGRVDAAVIGIGLFPDFRPHELTPVIDRDQIVRLADQVRQASGDRAPDLDAFLAIARRFSRSNPTVRLESFARVTLDPSLTSMPTELHTQLVALDGNGAVSPVVYTEGAAYIIRRGVTYPGRGEDPDSIRSELEREVLLERRRKRLDELLSDLRRVLSIRTWPGRLSKRHDDPLVR